MSIVDKLKSLRHKVLIGIYSALPLKKNKIILWSNGFKAYGCNPKYITEYILETSIVGYISIADLTRMSDIVRGRTYEAFFPLITTTIIYFVLIWMILFVVKRLEIEVTARSVRIKKIKKGINIK